MYFESGPAWNECMFRPHLVRHMVEKVEGKMVGGATGVAYAAQLPPPPAAMLVADPSAHQSDAAASRASSS